MEYIPSCKEEEEFLENFDPSKYQNPAVAADTALFCVKDNSLFVLLIERGGYPYKGCWALPGGFVNIDEDLPSSARRELKEETNLDIEYIEQAAVWGRPDRDPRQRVITVSFIALTDEENMNATAGDDAGKAEWFKISDYKKEIGEKETTISYSLLGSHEISASVFFPNGRIREVTRFNGGGLAFDHAESIALSTELLKSRSDFIAMQSLDKQKAATAAKVILDL
jgi:ADP-ribose pyrophosphatase YjhB (NUDIX family)